MIWLIPFVLTVFFSVLNGSRVAKFWQERILPYVPISPKPLGACVLCTSFWIGVGLAVAFYWCGWLTIQLSIVYAFYIAVATQILLNHVYNQRG